MKLTYRRLIDSIQAFREINTFEFMPRTTVDLYHLGKGIDLKLKDFDEFREKISTKYKDNPVSEKATKEFEALLDKEVEVDVKVIPFKTFIKSCPKPNTSMLIGLDWLIEIPDSFEEEESNVVDFPKVKDVEKK